MSSLERQIKNLKAEMSARPIRTATRGGVSSLPALYIVAGGKVLSDWGADGGKRITSALSAASLPPGTGGSPGDTVAVPANPIPSGLPDGIAVASRVADGKSVFVLVDSTCSITSDLIQGDLVILGANPSNLDVSSGGVTYRYVCYKSLARR